jgi:hypothetical protein
MYTGLGSTFTNCPQYGSQNCPQRWEDFNTGGWDPSLASPSSNPNSFWNVVEYTQGGADQSSEWFQMGDPLPYFISSLDNGTVCPQNSECKITVNAPSGVQPGDVLLANIEVGAVSSSNPGLPSGWTLLPISNLGTPENPVYQMQTEDSCHFLTSTWMAAHIYQAGETSYSFTDFNNGEATCKGDFSGILSGFIAAYRDAAQTLANLTAYGFPSDYDEGSFTSGAVQPSGEGTLLTIFSAENGLSGSGVPATFATPSAFAGQPTPVAESPLIGDLYGTLAIDVGVPAGGGSYGGYSTTLEEPDTCVDKDKNGQQYPDCEWYAFEVAIPQ